MIEQMDRPTDEELLFQPTLLINGLITTDTVPFALGRLEDIRTSGKPLIVELNTDGGDADAARRIALEVRLFRKHSASPPTVLENPTYIPQE